jgi:hypothetical protein
MLAIIITGLRLTRSIQTPTNRPSHWKGYEAKGVKYSKLKSCDLQSENGDRWECQSRDLTCKLGDCVTYTQLEEVPVMPKITFEPQQPTSLFWQHRLMRIVHIKIRRASSSHIGAHTHLVSTSSNSAQIEYSTKTQIMRAFLEGTP